MALNDFDLVLFGGGGDLSMRKLIPALYARDRAGDLPPTARIVCVGRHPWSDAEFVDALNANARPHIGDKAFSQTAWDKFCARIRYVSLDATDATTYQPLIDALRNDAKLTRVFYLAVSPTLFAQICHNLAERGLATDNSRVVLEKPLGRDLESAKQINQEVGRVFKE
ncbi:MAG TPA: glucose-6-phosphate dehydrogenase, partial [Oxalicibacterium sp.]